MAVVCISRQFGTDGVTLAKKVADALGYKYLDRAVIAKVAADAGVPTETVEVAEAEAGDRIVRFVNQMVSSSFLERHTGSKGSDLSEDKYVSYLRKVMNDFADQGNVVILGRGAQFILEDRTDMVKVLLMARRKDRIDMVVDRNEISRDQAKALVEREEERRVGFLRLFSKDVHPNNPGWYHMCLSASYLDPDQACEMVCHLAKMK